MSIRKSTIAMYMVLDTTSKCKQLAWKSSPQGRAALAVTHRAIVVDVSSDQRLCSKRILDPAEAYAGH